MSAPPPNLGGRQGECREGLPLFLLPPLQFRGGSCTGGRDNSGTPLYIRCRWCCSAEHSATNLEQGRGLRRGRLHKPLLLHSLRLKATSAPRPAAAAAHIPLHPFLLCGSTLHYSSGQFKPPQLFSYKLPASTFPSRHCKRNDDS